MAIEQPAKLASFVCVIFGLSFNQWCNFMGHMNRTSCKFLSNGILHKPLYSVLHLWQKRGMQKVPYPNNIHYLRTSLIKGAAYIAERIGVSVSNYSRMEMGLIPFEPYRKKLAAALRCKANDIDDSSLRKRTIPITMYVKNKSYVYSDPKIKGDKVIAPPGLPKSTQACVIKNPDHPDFPKNSLLYFDSNPTTSPSKFLDRQCIVKVDKRKRGDTLLAWITRGTQPDKFILHSKGQPMEIDVKVLAAYPILASVMP